jgi:hypothetical protein
MDLTTLVQFREETYRCFTRGQAALFNTVDALIAETQAKSFAELSLSPFFKRKWPSLYECFEDGRIERESLRKLFIKYLPQKSTEERLILGTDATPVARPFSRTSADRTALPMHNIPNKAPAITFGWKYSTLVVLPEKTSSWTYILDQQRISSDKTDIQIAIEQLKQIVPLLQKRPLILTDRGYDANWFWGQCSGIEMDHLGRLKSNRCFYKPAPPHSGKKGAPRKDGAKLKLSDPSTQETPDGTWEGTDREAHPVQIHWWENMHVKEARWLNLTIIQVIRPQAPDSEREPKISWFVYQGEKPQGGAGQVALFYTLRFGQEHGYRFDKQALLWTQARLRTPEQFDRWSQVVAIVHNLLVLARDLAGAELHPWENKQREHTPQQVRRGLAKLLSQLGTPAPSPKPRGKSKGRDKGAKVGKAKRFAVIFKKPKVPQTVSA